MLNRDVFCKAIAFANYVLKKYRTLLFMQERKCKSLAEAFPKETFRKFIAVSVYFVWAITKSLLGGFWEFFVGA